MSFTGYTFLAADCGSRAGANREAIDGFAAIAAALEQGVDDTAVNGGRIVDAAAIGFGWLALAAIIFYPTSQLAAIAICVGFMCVRSFIRYVFDFAGSSPAYSSPDVLWGGERSLLAA